MLMLLCFAECVLDELKHCEFPRLFRRTNLQTALVPAYNDAVGAASASAIRVGRSQALFDSSVYFAGNAALLGVLALGSAQVGFLAAIALLFTLSRKDTTMKETILRWDVRAVE